MRTQQELEEAVQRGITLLNENEPGWRDKIVMEDFDIRSCHRCVLGFVYKDLCSEYEDGFEVGVDQLNLAGETNAVYYGFDIEDSTLPNSRSEYNSLQAIWTREILNP